jgi:competence protein ComEC
VLVIKRIKAVWGYIGSLPVLQVSLACIAGSFFSWWISGLLGVGILVWVVARLRHEGQRSFWWAGFIAVAIRLLCVSDTLADNHVSGMNGNQVYLRGTVTGDIVMKPEIQSIVLETTEICMSGCDEDENWTSASGNVQTWIPRFPRVLEGEVLVIHGRLEQPSEFTDEFSYVGYLQSKDIYSVMYRPGVRYTGQREIGAVQNLLYRFRDRCIAKVNKLLPEPHASLLAGMLFGVKRGMPESFSLALQRTGTTHIIAASGYNVTLVVQAVFSLLSFLHRRARIACSIAGVWGFVILAGASPPVVRAGVMGTFTLAGVLLGSEATVHIGLPLSAALMILVSPEMIGDIGFQLSFLSSFGLVYGVPVLKRFLGWMPDMLEESTIVTMAAFIITAPLIIHHFGTISVIAIVANFLVIPTIAYVMALGVLLLLIPGFLELVATGISCAVWLPLEYFIAVVERLASLPFASVDIEPGGIMLTVSIYALILLAMVRFFPEENDKITYLGL